MKIISVTIRRAAKVSTGNYENTDIEITLVAEVHEGEAALSVAEDLTSTANAFLKQKIDDIEQGKRELKFKAHRFGV